MTNRFNLFIKRKFRELREKRGNKCEICGNVVNLQFAHIHGKETKLTGKRGRGRKERYYDIIKNPKSYVLLCEKCHKLYDAGVLKIEKAIQLVTKEPPITPIPYNPFSLVHYARNAYRRRIQNENMKRRYRTTIQRKSTE